MSSQSRQNLTPSTVSSDLSTAQTLAAEALGQGSSISAAAEAAAVHRATVHNWLNQSAKFSAAIGQSRAEHLEKMQDQQNELAALAMKTLRDIMEDPKASPSVRLKAALAVLNHGQWARQAENKKVAAPEEKLETELLSQLVAMERANYTAATIPQNTAAGFYPRAAATISS